MPDKLQYQNIAKAAVAKLYREITPERHGHIHNIVPKQDGTKQGETYTQYVGSLRDGRNFEVQVFPENTDVIAMDIGSNTTRRYSYDNRGRVS